MSSFWKIWITVWCWGVILFGAVLVLGGLAATDGAVRLLYTTLAGHPLPAGFLEAPGIRFSIALMGAVSLGWGFTILFLLPAIHAAGAPAWKGLTAGVVIWFVVDGIFSVLTGFALNILPNTALLIGLLIPLAASGAYKR